MTANLKNENNKAIHLRIFVIILTVAIIINVTGLTVGAVFLRLSMRSSIEDNLLVAVDITNKYVANEIELLKLRAAKAARDIRALIDEAGSIDNITMHYFYEGCILASICAEHPMYAGLAVFDETSLRAYSHGLIIDPDLLHEPFLQAAMSGGQAISTTKHCPDGYLVMYVSTPISEGLVLVAALPGLYLSNLMYQFTFWHSGRLFISDAEGTIISSVRQEWVQQRVNLIELGMTNSAYKGLGAMAQRGITGERGIAYFSLDSVQQICTFRPLSSANEDWFLGVIAPVHESALDDIPGVILLMGIITMVLSLVAAITAATMLKRPYNEVDHLRREAEIASLSKSTFLANMSNEIRTPMNSIMGFSELALDGEVSPATRDYLDKIYTNAEWLLHIINDILDISKVESGKMELENIPFDMQKLFAGCRTLITPKAAEKNIMLHFYAEPSIGKLPVGDPTRLRQVLENLLSNAVKFTDTGAVKLRAVIKEAGEKDIRVYFEVKDSGIGMTQEQIKKIFDPFMQAESGTTRKYGGTGLGLAITKNIVELMGGTLSVESTPGAGSKFSFELTFDAIDVSDDVVAEKQTAFNKIIITGLERPLFKREILLCEDNVMNQQVICEYLARVGIKTVVAENGKIGVEMVQSRKKKGEKQFDLVFMDMHMPVMDGLEAAAKIFELDADIPIVALTANIMLNDMEAYRKNGINDYLGKPFTSQELWNCLKNYFTPEINQPEPADTSEKNTPAEEEARFQKALRKMFVKNNSEKHKDITEALEKNDIKLAHRLTHNLKSNAGHLGKIHLQQVAEKVENSLKDGENLATPDQLEALETELKVALAEFRANSTPLSARPFVSAGKTEAVMELPDKHFALELLEELVPLIESGNPECWKYIDKLRLIPGSEKLINQITDLDFDQAIITLAELKKKLSYN